MEFEVSAELVGIYLEDAREHLALLDAALLRLEREGHDPEVAASLLGPLHTLKGNSGMIGFAGVKDYVHRLEEVFARARDGALVLDAGALDRLLQGATALRHAVESSCAAGRQACDLAPEEAALVALVESASAAPARPEPAATPAPPRAGAAADHATLAPARSTMVRVDFARLDHLLNLVGELIVARTKLHELARQIADVVPGAGPELLAAVHKVAGVSTQLQETIMDVRMLPIRHVFERFPRLVRDLARQQGKQVELVLQGEGTRVDKAVIDELGEPLVHLIRNAVDHGIEPPATRAARGKPAAGTILLSAAQESNQVVITLVDDGGESTRGRSGAGRSSGGSSARTRRSPTATRSSSSSPRASPPPARSPTCRGGGWGSTWWCRAWSGSTASSRRRRSPGRGPSSRSSCPSPSPSSPC